MIVRPSPTGSLHTLIAMAILNVALFGSLVIASTKSMGFAAALDFVFGLSLFLLMVSAMFMDRTAIMIRNYLVTVTAVLAVMSVRADDGLAYGCSLLLSIMSVFVVSPVNFPQPPILKATLVLMLQYMAITVLLMVAARSSP